MNPIKRYAYKIFKKPFFGRFEGEWRWPRDVSQEGWEKVTFKSETGDFIFAVLALSLSEEVKGGVVLAHPMGRAAKGFWLKHGHAQFLREAGFHVLAFDHNGFGESPSTSMDYPLDGFAAACYFKERFPETPLALVGASMGAMMSVCAMSREGQPFQAAVLEAAAPSLLDFWRKYPLPYTMMSLVKWLLPHRERAVRPIYHVQRLQGNPAILLIYGDADEFTPPEHGETLLRAMEGFVADVSLRVLPGVTHTHAYTEAPDAYKEQVLGFLTRTLAPS